MARKSPAHFLSNSASQAWTSLRPAWKKPNTAHHHLLIDSPLSGDELKQPVAMYDNRRHFGARQSEAIVTLPPGPHQLQLLLGGWSRIPDAPPAMSGVITVKVR